MRSFLAPAIRVGVLLLIVAVASGPLSVLAAEDSSSVVAPGWLSDTAPRVSKTGELTPNIEPYSSGLDCNETTILDPIDSRAFTGCAITTGAGPIVGKNMLFTDGTAPFGTVRTTFVQSYGDLQLRYNYSTSAMFMSPALQNDQLVFNRSSQSPGYNYTPSTSSQPKTTSGATANILPTSIAYSNNHEWMVAMVSGSPPYSIMVFDTKTYTGRKFIAPLSTYTTPNGGNETPGLGNLAISDDGRYVAVGYTQPLSGVANTKEKGLRVYDTTTCADQFSVPLAQRVYCRYKNVWTGKLDGKVVTSAGIQERLPDAVERPLNVRFKDIHTLSFTGLYGFVSPASFKVGSYEATMLPTPPPPPEPKKLLALGDSYISGEGAHYYVTGTDTDNNKCHQSAVSYPYILGEKYANEFHDVACSGAVMENIIGSNYPNQLQDPRPQNNYDNSETNRIIALGQVGMIEQIKFVSDLEPNIILLSIGGNDIGFGNIVKRCVLTTAGDSCYGRRSERISLLKTIYGTHQKLVDTYKKILEESPTGAKLYVVGYPQVVSTTGSCGLNVHLDDQERQFAEGLIGHLNAAIRNAAESAGVIYVDNSEALNGYKLCQDGAAGVNGLTAGDDNFGIGNESYHPTALGHSFLAASVSTKTSQFTVAPMPATNAGAPTVDASDPFVLAGQTDTAATRKIIFRTIVNRTVVAKGTPLNLMVNLAPGVDYTAVFRSEEVVVAAGKVTGDGVLGLTVTVPELTPGIHAVHIYTKDELGEDIDITEDIFVTASTDDYDGDGLKNSADELPYINETGVVIVPGPESVPDPVEAEQTEEPNSVPKPEETPDVTPPLDPPMVILDPETANETIEIAETPSSQSLKQPTASLNATVSRVTMVQPTVAPDVSQTRFAEVAQQQGVPTVGQVMSATTKREVPVIPERIEPKYDLKLHIFATVCVLMFSLIGLAIWQMRRTK